MVLRKAILNLALVAGISLAASGAACSVSGPYHLAARPQPKYSGKEVIGEDGIPRPEITNRVELSKHVDDLLAVHLITTGIITAGVFCTRTVRKCFYD